MSFSTQGTKVEMLLIGYLVKDPEMRYTQSEDPVTRLTVVTKKALDKSYKDREGNTVNVPCPNGWTEYGNKWTLSMFHTVSAWKGLALVVNQYLQNGDKVFFIVEPTGESVDGVVRVRMWEGNEGDTRANFESKLTDFTFFQKREKDGSFGPRQAPLATDDDDDSGFNLPF